MDTKFEPVSIATKEDYKLGGPVKWCAGCGGHAVLSTIMNVLPETGVPKEKVVFVSGIGCSSRFPYYINTYGFHSMHGRANAIATREVSIVIQRRPHCSATVAVVPEPQVGSSTRSPGSVAIRRQRSMIRVPVWTT